MSFRVQKVMNKGEVRRRESKYQVEWGGAGDTERLYATGEARQGRPERGVPGLRLRRSGPWAELAGVVQGHSADESAERAVWSRLPGAGFQYPPFILYSA